MFLEHNLCPASPTRFDRRRSLCLGGYAFALCALAACTQRLDANFDGDPLGAPLTSPAPTPPNDIFVWRTTFATAVVVANPAGGNWVRVTPTQAHLVSPDDRRVFLIANTEPLSAAGPQLSGGLRVGLGGFGAFGIGGCPAPRAGFFGAGGGGNLL